MVLIFLGACKPNFSVYQEPKKAKHSYSGKKKNDRWMDLKRDDILTK